VTLQWQPPAGGSPSQGYVVEAGSASGASDIGRFPTSPALSWGREVNAPGLVVEPGMTNIGTIVTAWNSVAFVAKDSGGRVLGCGYKRVYGPTNAEVPGYGVTNVLRPGEQALTLNHQPWINSAIPAAAVASVTPWPLWKE